MLHAASTTQNSWIAGKVLLAEIGSESATIRELFKSKVKWTELIESDGRGKYRLRLPNGKN